MSNIPANSHLWSLCVIQAKAKFNAWPSANASAWVHQKYAQMGGKFVGSVDQMTASQKKDYEQLEAQKEKDAAASKQQQNQQSSF